VLAGVIGSRAKARRIADQMRPHGIDYLGPLPHQKIARAMQHQPALLLGRFDLYETQRTVGRRAASQIASASAASFLLRLT
jgi:hypothetical protein